MTANEKKFQAMAIVSEVFCICLEENSAAAKNKSWEWFLSDLQ